ncbi:hypothetical protein TNCV_65671 [Trichonephila clavipes]|nr:hypothetical protein TNCV_65671 [Trichonephila clavipes]
MALYRSPLTVTLWPSSFLKKYGPMIPPAYKAHQTDSDKVELHMDIASSHTSKSNAAYLAKKESEAGIKCIPFDEILKKSPDASPMNYSAFCLLKQALGKRQPNEQ